MRIVVDVERCQTHGVCVEEAPELFRIENEELVVIDERPPASLREKLEMAVRYCPTQAIRIQED
jgi:ferredoxin